MYYCVLFIWCKSTELVSLCTLDIGILNKYYYYNHDLLIQHNTIASVCIDVELHVYVITCRLVECAVIMIQYRATDVRSGSVTCNSKVL